MIGSYSRISQRAKQPGSCTTIHSGECSCTLARVSIGQYLRVMVQGQDDVCHVIPAAGSSDCVPTQAVGIMHLQGAHCVSVCQLIRACESFWGQRAEAWTHQAGAVQSFGQWTLHSGVWCSLPPQFSGRSILWNVLKELQLTLRMTPPQRQRLVTPPGSPLTNQMTIRIQRPKKIIRPSGR